MNLRNTFLPMLAIAGRQLRKLLKNPSLSAGYLAFPLLFLAFGGGGLSALEDLSAFGFSSGYTAFYFAFVLLQGVSFTGVAAGAAIASDFETGFSRRLLLAMPRRTSLVTGYVLTTVVLGLLVALVLFAVSVATGMQVDGNVLEIAALIGLAILLSIVFTLWGAGVALRIRSMQAEPIMSMPTFLGFMLAPAFVPRALLEGWIRAVADFNPLTIIMEAGRGLISGQPDQTALAFLIILGLFVALSVWSLSGLRQAECSG